MKKIVFALAAVAAVVCSAADARASGCSGPFCKQSPGPSFGGLFGSGHAPAFQAAPWYLYWPYNAHFMTPAPLGGAFYAPPTAGMYGNPYFPGYPAPAGPVYTPNVIPPAPAVAPVVR